MLPSKKRGTTWATLWAAKLGGRALGITTEPELESSPGVPVGVTESLSRSMITDTFNNY